MAEGRHCEPPEVESNPGLIIYSVGINRLIFNVVIEGQNMKKLFFGIIATAAIISLSPARAMLPCEWSQGRIDEEKAYMTPVARQKVEDLERRMASLRQVMEDTKHLPQLYPIDPLLDPASRLSTLEVEWQMKMIEAFVARKTQERQQQEGF